MKRGSQRRPLSDSTASLPLGNLPGKSRVLDGKKLKFHSFGGVSSKDSDNNNTLFLMSKRPSSAVSNARASSKGLITEESATPAVTLPSIGRTLSINAPIGSKRRVKQFYDIDSPGRLKVEEV